MSIDDLARAAAAAAHRRAEQEVVPMTMLEDLRRTRRSRNVGTAVAVAAVVVTASVVSLSLFDRGENAPVVPGATSPTVLPSSGSGDPCADPDVTCLSDERYKVAMIVPVTLTMPATFSGDLNRLSNGTLEVYRDDVDQTGVTVFERATAVKDTAAWSPDPAAGQSAHAMATWLHHRPFLVDASMTRTTVGGLEAWRVSATLKPGAHLPATKPGAGFSVAPTFTSDDGTATAGYGEQLTGDYTLVDVPGAGVTVIWSWTLQDDRSVLHGNQPYIDSLSFG